MIGSLVDSGFAAWVDRKMQDHLPYPADRTALLLVDVQRAFFDESGPGFDLIADVAKPLGFTENVARLTSACRDLGITIFHCPFEVPADADAIPFAERLRETNALLPGGDDGEVPNELRARGDVLLEGRSTLNVFYGTDLGDRLEAFETTHLIVCGSVADAGVDSTGRMGVELGYDVTYASDCIAAFDTASHAASIDVTFPRMAHRVWTADEILAQVASS